MQRVDKGNWLGGSNARWMVNGKEVFMSESDAKMEDGSKFLMNDCEM